MDIRTEIEQARCLHTATGHYIQLLQRHGRGADSDGILKLLIEKIKTRSERIGAGLEKGEK